MQAKISQYCKLLKLETLAEVHHHHHTHRHHHHHHYLSHVKSSEFPELLNKSVPWLKFCFILHISRSFKSTSYEDRCRAIFLLDPGPLNGLPRHCWETDP